MRIAIIFTAVAAITGCASTTGVVPTGPETYMVANHGVMGYSSAGAQKAQAFQQAIDYCKKIGKDLQPVNTSESPSGFGKIAAAELEFKCVTPRT